MAKKPKTQTVESLLGDINERLDSIADTMSFLILSKHRFRKGQRVKFNAKARQQGFDKRAKGGRVVEAGDSILMMVLLDGYKRPHVFHNSFFD